MDRETVRRTSHGREGCEHLTRPVSMPRSREMLSGTDGTRRRCLPGECGLTHLCKSLSSNHGTSFRIAAAAAAFPGRRCPLGVLARELSHRGYALNVLVQEGLGTEWLRGPLRASRSVCVRLQAARDGPESTTLGAVQRRYLPRESNLTHMLVCSVTATHLYVIESAGYPACLAYKTGRMHATRASPGRAAHSPLRVVTADAAAAGTSRPELVFSFRYELSASVLTCWKRRRGALSSIAGRPLSSCARDRVEGPGISSVSHARAVSRAAWIVYSHESSVTCAGLTRH